MSSIEGPLGGEKLISDKAKVGKLAEVKGMGKLEIVPVDQLHIDRSYQREVSMDLVQRIAEKWDPVSAGPIVVSRRTDGNLYVVNGQHRYAAAQLAGETEMVAQVIEGLDRDTEAELRLRGNTRRSDRSLERFRAQVVAGYPESLAIVELLGEFDTHINKTPSEHEGINSVAVVEWIYRVDKGVLLVRVLETVKDAYSRAHGRAASGALLKGIAWFLLQHGGDYDRGRLIERMTIVGTSSLNTMARTHKAALGGSLWLNFYRALVEAYNDRLTEANKLEWRTKGYSQGSKSGASDSDW